MARSMPCPFCGHGLTKHGRGHGNGGDWGSFAAAPNCTECSFIPCPLRRMTIESLYRGHTSVESVAKNDGRWTRERIERAQRRIEGNGKPSRSDEVTG